MKESAKAHCRSSEWISKDLRTSCSPYSIKNRMSKRMVTRNAMRAYLPSSLKIFFFTGRDLYKERTQSTYNSSSLFCQWQTIGFNTSVKWRNNLGFCNGIGFEREFFKVLVV